MSIHLKSIFKFRQIGKIGVIGFFSAIGFAFVSTIWSLYLNNFLNNMSYVGFLTTFFMIVSLISYVFLIPIVQKNSKTFLYLFALVVYFLSYLFFSFFNNLFIVIFIGIFLSVVCSLRINVFGIIVADKSKKGRLSENEGIISTLTNLAWLIGPLIAGFIAQMYRLNLVFLFASFFYLTCNSFP